LEGHESNPEAYHDYISPDPRKTDIQSRKNSIFFLIKQSLVVGTG
jgi:hypothetical protein